MTCFFRRNESSSSSSPCCYIPIYERLYCPINVNQYMRGGKNKAVYRLLRLPYSPLTSPDHKIIFNDIQSAYHHLLYYTSTCGKNEHSYVLEMKGTREEIVALVSDAAKCTSEFHTHILCAYSAHDMLLKERGLKTTVEVIPNPHLSSALTSAP